MSEYRLRMYLIPPDLEGIKSCSMKQDIIIRLLINPTGNKYIFRCRILHTGVDRSILIHFPFRSLGICKL